MKYVSTRGTAPVLSFGDVLLTGLARDGGLYVPEQWPPFAEGELARYASLPYAQVACDVMWPFVADSLDRDTFESICEDAYATFDDPEVVPLRDLGDNTWLMELFHGPTFAFKDVALQLVGRLFDHELAKRGEHITIVGATSGDTGSAAIEACRDRDAIEVFIMHPAGRVSEVQRRQMTTVDAPNVHNIAIAGTFDDCQDLVKALFNDATFRDEHHLSAVNSINWARIMAQIVYYVVGAVRLGDAGAKPVAFSVPTGNFGNIFAGFAAQKMGAAISQFVVGSNENDILTRFLDTGTMRMAGVHPTLSPSMDIQVSSNFERLLFEMQGRDGERVAALMAEFREAGEYTLEPEPLGLLHEQWAGARIDDEATTQIIKRTFERTGVLVDPHTAVGLGAAERCRKDPSVPLISLATAHPAKFGDAVRAAVGTSPELPPRLAAVLDRPEHYVTLPNDFDAVRQYITSTVG